MWDTMEVARLSFFMAVPGIRLYHQLEASMFVPGRITGPILHSESPDGHLWACMTRRRTMTPPQRHRETYHVGAVILRSL